MYINTYVLSVAEEKKEDYLRVAGIFSEVAQDFGEHTDYRKAVQAKPGEEIVLAWVIWPDRETATLAHTKMYKDKRMEAIGDMPFDGKKMIMGGFEPLLSYRNI